MDYAASANEPLQKTALISTRHLRSPTGTSDKGFLSIVSTS
jgi:hypothetical protein